MLCHVTPTVTGAGGLRSRGSGGALVLLALGIPSGVIAVIVIADGRLVLRFVPVRSDATAMAARLFGVPSVAWLDLALRRRGFHRATFSVCRQFLCRLLGSAG
jgi:hypothetical protein